MLVHLGDIEDDPEKIRGWLDAVTDGPKPVPAVFIQGNCDRYGGRELKKSAIFELNGYRFFCTHGHVQGVNYGLENLIFTAMENECDIVMYGHTHFPLDEEYGAFGSPDGCDVRILNPGSISLPRGGSNKSYMVMTFDENENYEVELKDL